MKYYSISTYSPLRNYIASLDISVLRKSIYLIFSNKLLKRKDQ
jgi:hypothetical protein